MKRAAWMLGCTASLCLAAGGCQRGTLTQESAALAGPDKSWVRLDGRVVTAHANGFELNYGDGSVTVELDDFDEAPEGSGIHENDQVVVYGRLDRERYRRNAVEARAVYDQNAATTFFASSADEEAIGPWPRTHVEIGAITVGGKVSSIANHSFVLDTGSAELTVDVTALGYDPFKKLHVGDRVYVEGRINTAFFAAQQLQAQRLTSVHLPAKRS